MKSALIIFGILIAGGAAAPQVKPPKAWKREIVVGLVRVESNPWGGFGQKTFELVTSGNHWRHESESLAFATRDEYMAAERLNECAVEVIGIRANRAGSSWIIVEQIREARP